jgi:uncharacterized integral membrane protein
MADLMVKHGSIVWTAYLVGFIFAAAIVFIVFETLALKTHGMTFSAWMWNLQEVWPLSGFLTGFLMGGLIIGVAVHVLWHWLPAGATSSG